MSGISKRVSGSWVSGDYGIMKTATDTITTLPANLYADGNNATVGISGNMVQNGTQTPDNPIYPSGCGDLETTGEHAGQYKIPISSASTTTPIYLGEVETTRQIKKLVLTGAEKSLQLYTNSAGKIGFNIEIFSMLSNSRINGFCTHFVPIQSIAWTNQNNVCFGANNRIIFFVFSDVMAAQYNITDLTSIKAYLQAQYAAGTPVTVWYVLAEPTTGIVNEPLRKIGDYADEVSGITIPTIAGENTISVDTTLHPSEVTVNYKGWHPVADVHERENGQWN